MKRGREYHRTAEEKKQYNGFNWDTGDKFEGRFLTLAEVAALRAAGYMLDEGATMPVGLPYGA